MSDHYAIPDEQIDALIHYGVPGMKWGNKKTPLPRSEKYSKGAYRMDVALRGTKNANRINKAVTEGRSLKSARRRNTVGSTLRSAGVGAAVGVGYTVLTAGPLLKQMAGYKLNQTVANKQYQNRAKAGAKVAADLFSDKRGIGNYATVALKFDKNNNSWG